MLSDLHTNPKELLHSYRAGFKSARIKGSRSVFNQASCRQIMWFWQAPSSDRSH